MSEHTSSLDASELWAAYAYNPLTGKLFLIKRNRYVKGNTYVDSRNYKGLRLAVPRDNKWTCVNYSRAVYAWFTGKWADKGFHIDHINGDSFDNRVWNLRMVTVRENNQNRRNQGSAGIYWNKRIKRWQSQIRIDGKKVYLGVYRKESEALQAYIDACDANRYSVLSEVRDRLIALRKIES